MPISRLGVSFGARRTGGAGQPFGQGPQMSMHRLNGGMFPPQPMPGQVIQPEYPGGMPSMNHDLGSRIAAMQVLKRMGLG